MMSRFVCLFLLITSIVLIASATAHAKIKRGCSGSIYVNSYPTGVVKLAEMDASGFCKNKRKAKECRMSALRVIRSCAETLWHDRNLHKDEKFKLPLQCTTKPESPRSGMNYFRWTQRLIFQLQHHTDSIKDRVEHNVCCLTNQHDGRFQAKIRWTSSGDRGCAPSSGSFVGASGAYLSTTYGVDCEELRENGLCGQ